MTLINREYNKYYHRVYGLNIESQIELKELLTVEESNAVSEPVEIIYGVMSEDIKKLIENGKKTYFTRSELWFHINNVATYFVKGGKQIIVEPYENADMSILKIYLMCSCLGFIMLQRDMVAIHGGTIVIDNQAIILTGDKGAGKSTLTTALRLNGYPFISDDVAATAIDKIPMVKPGFPYQKLCSSAMDKLGYNKEEHEAFMGDSEVKYMVPAHNEFVDYDVKLSGMCELTVGNVDDVQIEEIKGNEKLNKVIANIYRGEYIKYLGGMSPQYFKQCIEIARNIKFYKITRPENQFTVDEQIKLIEEKFINVNNRELELV